MALEKKVRGSPKSSWIHCLETMNVCTKYHANPFIVDKVSYFGQKLWTDRNCHPYSRAPSIAKSSALPVLALWSTLCTHICSNTSTVAFSSLQSVSDTAIHCELMLIGRALIQKETLQNNNLRLKSHVEIHPPPRTQNTQFAVQTQTCIQNTCIYAFTDTMYTKHAQQMHQISKTVF